METQFPTTYQTTKKKNTAKVPNRDTKRDGPQN